MHVHDYTKKNRQFTPQDIYTVHCHSLPFYYFLQQTIIETNDSVLYKDRVYWENNLLSNGWSLGPEYDLLISTKTKAQIVNISDRACEWVRKLLKSYLI